MLLHTVIVKTPIGNAKLQVFPPFITESIKEELSIDKSIPPYCQQLTFRHQVLEDGHTFGEYNLQGGSTVSLAVKNGSKYIV